MILLRGWPYDIHSLAEVTIRRARAAPGGGAGDRDANGAPHPDPSAYTKKFTGKYVHRNMSGGIGHNLPQEAPKAFADAVIDVARMASL